MAGLNSTQTRVDSRNNNRRHAPYILFSSNGISYENVIGMHLVCYYCYYLLLSTYFLALPSLLISSIYLVAFICYFF